MKDFTARVLRAVEEGRRGVPMPVTLNLESGEITLSGETHKVSKIEWDLVVGKIWQGDELSSEDKN